MKQRRRRSYAFIYTKIIASSPFIEVELNLTPKQMSMFIKGLKYIAPCQSQFSKKTKEERMNEQYQALLNVIKKCLGDNSVSASDQRAQQAFSELQQLHHHLHMKKLPHRLGIRAKRECSLVKSIQRLINRQPHIVVRRTDKSKVFYIGRMEDFLKKAMDYMVKTEAYTEILSNESPLQQNYNRVKTTVETLWKNKIIDRQQQNRLLPQLKTLELAHLHFIPKPHKVN